MVFVHEGASLIDSLPLTSTSAPDGGRRGCPGWSRLVPAPGKLVYHRHSMPSSLRSSLSALAQNFAGSILDAIRSSSLEDLRTESSGSGVGNGRRTRVAGGGGQPDPLRGARKAKSGRLARRSPEQIAKALDQVVALVKGKKDGLRAEQIKKALGMDRREVPRVLQEGLSKKKIKSKGQKRATTYSAT